ncbi:Molybdopterin-guanine dinucleotide biosynthesis protein A [Jatrophihabitans endophyticus]|uniref:Molybdopterin-guanine dinucleotide biosynthesis protein A n=1 Tax=Jatrophihabitans endophyticus TaxID=1206085 RepID=A0A1M5LMG4_9ACTN|nr:NTP transferase domain-containing protein [Jatrophihabitans endophyticus]SHG66156.1 Molybdopterin-guanine dinucleotide biosynthesis protein A [Jatrophihabitans endophyticus]
MDGPAHDAIVLAGGRARRLAGADKPAEFVGGASLLDRALGAVPGAGRVVVAGPRRPVARAVSWCVEQPAGGGPVAGLAAAVPLTTAALLVVLAADLPWVAPAVPLLLAAVPPDGRAVLADTGGRDNHLAACWRRATLLAALARLPVLAGASMRSLAADVATVRVTDRGGWGQDCDTWDDLAAARARVHD